MNGRWWKVGRSALSLEPNGGIWDVSTKACAELSNIGWYNGWKWTKVFPLHPAASYTASIDCQDTHNQHLKRLNLLPAVLRVGVRSKVVIWLT